jgi:hypothetical protein
MANFRPNFKEDQAQDAVAQADDDAARQKRVLPTTVNWVGQGYVSPVQNQVY